MIRRQHEHQGIFILFRDVHSPQANAGRRVLSDRLAQNILLRQLRQLLPDKGFVVLLVAIKMSSISTSGKILSTVSWIIVLSSSVSDKNCLGRFCPALGPETLSASSGHNQRCFFHGILSPFVRIAFA